MYPNSASATFDIDYYCNTHIPMAEKLLADALKGCTVDYGLAGGAADESAPFIAIGHLSFNSVADFQNAFGPHAKQIMSDVPNYTNTQPQIQISEIKI
jgi:uncharacterized protein (TIGR02118 family)